MAAAVLRSAALPDTLGVSGHCAVATDTNSSPSSSSSSSSSSVSAGTRPRRVRVAARRMVPASAVLMEEERDTYSRASTSGAGPGGGGGGFSTGTRDARGRFHMLLPVEQPTTTAAAMTPSQLDQVDRPEPELELETDSSELELETDSLWLQMRAEARADSAAEPALVSYLYSTVLAHRSLERALAFHLGNKLSSSTLLSTQLFSLILDTLTADAGIRAAVRADLRAVKARDPACVSYAHAMLNFKGFQACQAYRVAHRLWLQGRASLALAIQSRVSEVFHVDIHPAARIGKGVLFDHATGVVVGETACIGDDVSILHHVTLGGTGAAGGARHPRIGDGVLIGAGATILGNVRVGECAKIGAGSVVLIDVPPRATAVGNPARVVAAKPRVQGQGEAPAPSPSETMDHASVATAWSDYVI